MKINELRSIIKDIISVIDEDESCTYEEDLKGDK